MDGRFKRFVQTIPNLFQAGRSLGNYLGIHVNSFATDFVQSIGQSNHSNMKWIVVTRQPRVIISTVPLDQHKPTRAVAVLDKLGDGMQGRQLYQISTLLVGFMNFGSFGMDNERPFDVSLDHPGIHGLTRALPLASRQLTRSRGVQVGHGLQNWLIHIICPVARLGFPRDYGA